MNVKVKVATQDDKARWAAKEAEAERLRLEPVTTFARVLNEVRTLRGPVVLPLLIDNAGAWFVRKLSKEDLLLIGALMDAEGFSMYEIDEPDAQRVFFKALLLVGVCKGYPTGSDKRYPDCDLDYLREACDNTARFFASMQEVEALWQEPGLDDIVTQLTVYLLKLNPQWSLQPDAKKKPSPVEQVKAPQSPLPKRPLLARLRSLRRSGRPAGT